MAHAVTDHSHSQQMAEAAAGGFAEATLEHDMLEVGPGGLRQARKYGASPAALPEANSLGQRRSSSVALAASGRFAPGLNRSRELDCLTQAVYFEARGETPRGQAAVAQVVLNRVKHPAFPKSVCAVVYQGAARRGCQFSFACDGSMRRGREAAAWGRARKVASRALSGVVLADVGSATHFHTTGVSPGWGPRMMRVSQVGLHIFYRFNPRARVPAAAERPVLASLPAEAMPPTAPLRLASALVEKTLDATLSVPAPQAQVPPPANAPAAVKPQPTQSAPAGLTKTSDATPPAQGASPPADS
jgi:hypothetical protein